MLGIGKNYREKLSTVLRKDPYILNSKKTSEALKVSQQEAGRLLSRWHESGWISRIKRGVYVPLSLSSKNKEPVIEEPSLIADLIYGSGYVAGFSAVKHWDLSEQIRETATYYTTKQVKNRSPVHGGAKFQLKTISKYKVFGLKSIWFGSKKVKVSDPTKTVIDILDDPKMVGGMRVASDVIAQYLESEYFNFDLLIEYGKKMKNSTIFKRLGFLSEVKLMLSSNQLEKLEELISQNYSEFDPDLDCNRCFSRWKLKLPSSWMKEYDRKN